MITEIYQFKFGNSFMLGFINSHHSFHISIFCKLMILTSEVKVSNMHNSFKLDKTHFKRLLLLYLFNGQRLEQCCYIDYITSNNQSVRNSFLNNISSISNVLLYHTIFSNKSYFTFQTIQVSNSQDFNWYNN